MKIKLVSLLVTNQQRALDFYTQIAGFTKKTEIEAGEHKWLTIVSSEELNGVELLLEPMSFAPARDYQRALYEAGIPATAFEVNDVEEEYNRLLNLGVRFSMPPTHMGTATAAIFDDTCGNHIQIYEV